MLDAHDNLPMSMKCVTDTIASLLTGDRRPGRADGCLDLKIRYDQRKPNKGELTGVEITIEETK